VANVNDAPVAEAGPNQTVDEGDVVQFDGSGTDDDDLHTMNPSEVLSYSWDFNDGSPAGTGVSPTHVYNDNGTYTVTLTVTDNASAFDTDTLTVTVENVAPTVDAGVGPPPVSKGQTVIINGSFTDPGTSDTHIATIDWGDGTIEDSATSPNVSVDEINGTVTASHAYAENGDFTVTLTVTDDDGDSGTDTLTVTVKGLELIPGIPGMPGVPGVPYNVLGTTLTLTFNNPVDPSATRPDRIGFEVGNSGNWDIAFPPGIELDVQTLPGDPYTIVIDISPAHVATMNLLVAALVSHEQVDLLLAPGAFSDIEGDESLEVLGTDDVTVRMMADGMVLGILGDVTGDGKVAAYDAALILKATIEGPDAFPANPVALQVNALLKVYGCDIMTYMADADSSGDISAYDSSLVLQRVAGITPSAPVIDSSIPRICKLNVSSCGDRELEMSIDLDNASDVYSADIVMIYNPQTLTVADVSKTSSVSGWLFEHGETGSGKFRMSLAGLSQPAADGSLITLSFHAASADAVKQLDITEFKLNGGRLKTEVKNLPKAFALLQNYPNPFNPETWIPYQLSEPADVAITIYNLNGQMVRRLVLGSKMPDHYIDRSRAAYWDGRNESGEGVSSGVYFYQLQAGRDSSVRKMIIVK
jgi:PKD repeat protein